MENELKGFCVIDDTFEKKVTEDEYTKSIFYKFMKQNGIDFEDIDDATRLPKALVPVVNGKEKEFIRFNLVIYNLHKENKVNIVDALLTLMEDYFDHSEIEQIIDEQNKFILRNQLKQKFNMDGHPIISKFF